MTGGDMPSSQRDGETDEFLCKKDYDCRGRGGDEAWTVALLSSRVTTRIRCSSTYNQHALISKDLRVLVHVHSSTDEYPMRTKRER